jgi:hypothetical protein
VPNRGRTLVAEAEALLGDVLEDERVVRAEVRNDNLVERLVQQEHLVTARMELFDKGRFEQVGRRLPDAGEEENLEWRDKDERQMGGWARN